MNKLYFGDCLDILKELLHKEKEGFIDLIYIDPPFNSKRNYNILFEDANLKDVKAQKEAFADTWSNISYKDTLQKIQELDLDLYSFLTALDKIRISKSAISYLTTMAIRIYYIHKVLKDTGSFYLHCDYTMSHYLKLVCDLIFNEGHFRNEVIWKRTNNPKGSQFKDRKYGVYTDTLLFYTKSDKYTFELDKIRTPLTEKEILEKYPKIDSRGRYLEYPIIRSASKGERPNLVYKYKGYTPPKWGWVIRKEKLEEIDARGDLGWRDNGSPYRKYRSSEDRGHPIGNLWDDILRIQSNAEEALDYPTQKPIALLNRIIEASSNDGDLVADFFCGCGTTIASAQKLNRRWLGVDISHLAIGLIERKRLIEPYGKEIKSTYEVFGLPKDLASARKLASGVEGGRLKFQDWVIETMIGGVCNPKRTADGGWDGHLTFEIPDRNETSLKETVLIEVKSGNVNVKNLREFIQVVNKQKASMGVFVCFKDEVTKPMELEAKEQGYYGKKICGNRFDKIQILTVDDLLEGRNINMPTSTKGTFKTASKVDIEKPEQSKLFKGG